MATHSNILAWAISWTEEPGRLQSMGLQSVGHNFMTGHGFPDSSFGQESSCKAGDPSLIPGSGRSAGEGIGYTLQCSWASLVAQLVKYPSAVWETWVQSLVWEYPLEKGKATYSSILAWRIPWAIQSMGSQRVEHGGATFTGYWTTLKDYSLFQVFSERCVYVFVF